MTDALSRLVDLSAHQLRNPMQSIVVNLEVLRIRISRLHPELWDELEGHAVGIEEAVRKLEGRVELLVGLARADREETERAAPARLLRELIETAGFGQEPRLEVVAVGEPTARVSAGRLTGLLFRLLEVARAGSSGDVRLRVAEEAGVVTIRVPVGEPVAESAEVSWAALEEAAGRAGGRLRRDPGGEAVLTLPAG